MDKLTVRSALQLLDNMSYEDTKTLEDVIFNRRLDHIFRISAINVKYTITADNRDEAIKKFVKSKDFTKREYKNIYGDSDYFFEFGSLYCKYCKKEEVKEEGEYTYNAQYRHIKTNHIDKIIKNRINIFNKKYTCKSFIDEFEEDEMFK